jgi:hypothetical protein
MDILGGFVISCKMEGFFRKVAEITAKRHVPPGMRAWEEGGELLRKEMRDEFGYSALNLL